MGETNNDETLSSPMTVVGMVNGMIGGLILILPVLAFDAGYILTFIVILVTGIFSYYSCYLCVEHMGDQPDLDFAILRHFNGNRTVKVLYDLCVWSNLILIDMLYFQLIVIQWMGLIPPYDYSIINPLINAVILFSLVFVLKYFQFGASVMAYGIISIITYLIFLIWVMATSDQGYDNGPYKPFGSGAASMAAAMGQAFSIQSFFIPVLKKNKNPKKYVFYTMLAYIFGALAYYYIAYMGSFGILHRQYTSQSSSQKTIEGYFGEGAWQVNIIEGIYLIHLYSVFPEFMLISKKRLFGVLKIQQSHKGKVTLAEVIYIALAVGVCLTIGLLQVSITDIIDINGAVIGFFFIYFLPAGLHIKCLYFSKGKLPVPTLAIENEGEQDERVENQEPKSSDALPRKQSDIQIQNKAVTGLGQPLLQGVPESSQDPWKYSCATVPKLEEVNNEGIHLKAEQVQNSYFYCNCDKSKYTPVQRVLDLGAMSIMVILGAFIMVNGIYSVAS